jgi:hypothetical protein
VSTAAELLRIRDDFQRNGSVRFLQVKVANDQPGRVMPTRDAVANKLRFRRAVDAESAPSNAKP